MKEKMSLAERLASILGVKNPVLIQPQQNPSMDLNGLAVEQTTPTTTECVTKEATQPTKKSRRGSKRITTEKELLEEERKAYKRWWALRKRKKELGMETRKLRKSAKKPKDNWRYGTVYQFYWETFKKNGGRLERTYNMRRKVMEKSGQAYSAYLNKCLQALEKFGTDEDKKRFKGLIESNIN